jgi:hypothetical protein
MLAAPMKRAQKRLLANGTAPFLFLRKVRPAYGVSYQLLLDGSIVFWRESGSPRQTVAR